MTNRYIYAVGRRKSTTAIVKLFPHGTGVYTIHHGESSHDLKSFFGGNAHLYANAISPLTVLGDTYLTGYDADITVRGGGTSGISDAIRLGFSRCLVENDIQLRTTLKPFGFLKRDPRVKERKKFGLRKARKGQKRSKR